MRDRYDNGDSSGPARPAAQVAGAWRSLDARCSIAAIFSVARP